MSSVNEAPDPLNDHDEDDIYEEPVDSVDLPQSNNDQLRSSTLPRAYGYTNNKRYISLFVEL